MAKKTLSLIDILNNEEGRALVEQLEEAEEEIRGRGIDWDDDEEFYVRLQKSLVIEIKEKFGYQWE